MTIRPPRTTETTSTEPGAPGRWQRWPEMIFAVLVSRSTRQSAVRAPERERLMSFYDYCYHYHWRNGNRSNAAAPVCNHHALMLCYVCDCVRLQGCACWTVMFTTGIYLFLSGQSCNQSINQSIHPSIHYSFNQSIDPSIHQSINQSINQSMELSMGHTVTG